MEKSNIVGSINLFQQNSHQITPPTLYNIYKQAFAFNDITKLIIPLSAENRMKFKQKKGQSPFAV